MHLVSMFVRSLSSWRSSLHHPVGIVRLLRMGLGIAIKMEIWIEMETLHNLCVTSHMKINSLWKKRPRFYSVDIIPSLLWSGLTANNLSTLFIVPLTFNKHSRPYLLKMYIHWALFAINLIFNYKVHLIWGNIYYVM